MQDCLLPFFYIKPQRTGCPKQVGEIVSYLFSTSNHNQLFNRHNGLLLSLTFFLHQTTTLWRYVWFYIKPQHRTILPKPMRIVSYLFSTSNHNSSCLAGTLSRLSLTFFLHQTTTGHRDRVLNGYCLLPFFYIKPQPDGPDGFHRLIVSYLFSTSNHNRLVAHHGRRWIVSYLFSTSNHNLARSISACAFIVSYLFSTSNHNPARRSHLRPCIVSYLFSTSNHNVKPCNYMRLKLSLTFFLHQTTTLPKQVILWVHCLLPFFLHQTTT